MSKHTSPELQWLWREVRPFVRYQAASLFLTILASGLGMTSPLLVKWLIDDVLPNRRWGALAVATGLFFLVSVAGMMLGSAARLINTSAVQRFTLRLRSRLLTHVQSLPAAFHARHPTGDLMQRIEGDVRVVTDSGSDVLPSVVRMVVDTLMTVAAMFLLDWRVALVVAPLVPLLAYIRERFRPFMRRGADEMREAIGKQSSLLNELLAGVIQIQLLGAEHRLSRRYLLVSLKAMARQMSQEKRELLFTLCSMTTIGLGTALIVGYGGIRVLMGSLTAGGLVAFYSYVGNIFSPMTTAMDLYARLNRVRASIRRLIELEQTSVAFRDAPDAAPVTDSPQVVVCTDVDFAYTPGQPTLSRVDMTATAGERIAIVGESGCGKSSLLKLIPRLYDPTHGRIEVDGRDVRAVQLRSLRRAVSFVPQEPILFQGTLRDNLKHGCPSARPEDIAQAAWIACLLEVVDRLPAGWDTELGPMGIGLSGGEKQRVAITRALLQRRPILILDEATSALDSPTENLLLSRLKEWCAGRIVIVVSHRLSAARWATRVVVVNRGQVVEEGTHASLYQAGTRYFALWQRGDANGAKRPSPAGHFSPDAPDEDEEREFA